MRRTDIDTEMSVSSESSETPMDSKRGEVEAFPCAWGGQPWAREGSPRMKNRHMFTRQVKREQSQAWTQWVQTCGDSREHRTFCWSLECLALGFYSCSALSLTFKYKGPKRGIFWNYSAQRPGS